MNTQIIKSKKIKVLAQRHLVIPKEYYDALIIGEELTIEFHEGHLVIKPIVKVDEDFAENLLEELMAKFKEVKQIVLHGEKPYL